MPYLTCLTAGLQQARQLPHFPPWSGAGQVLCASSVTTLLLCVQALGSPPLIFELDNLMTRLAGTSPGSIAIRNARSCVGNQCRVPGVLLHTSKILRRCSTLWMSPASCHLKTSKPVTNTVMAWTHLWSSRLFNLRYCAFLIFGYLV